MGFTIKLDFDATGLDDLVKAREQSTVLDNGIRALAEQALTNVEMLTPGETLPKMWKKQEEQDGSGHVTSITIENTDERQDVLGFMEHGTSPHVIEPKPGNAINRLVFYWPAVSATVFAKRVDHPGTIAYKMVAGTVDILNKQMNQWTNSMEHDISAELNQVT